VQALERTLAPQAHSRPLDDLAVAGAFRARGRARRGALLSRFMPLAAAAAVAILVAAWLLRRPPSTPAAPRQGWAVAPLAGAPRADGRAISGADKLAVGEWLVTDATSRAQLAVADIGSLEIASDTRVRVVRSGPTEHRLELAQGRIHAEVTAPPRLFVVDTPAATATDLGCAYDLDVDRHGTGSLLVTSGWVELGRDAHLVVVPAGARADLSTAGPHTPYFIDAGPDFVAALAHLDRAPAGSPDALIALADVLVAARLRDSLTLWHLIQRGSPGDRTLALDRMVALGVFFPDNAPRERLLAGDPVALQALRDALIPVWFPGALPLDVSPGGLGKQPRPTDAPPWGGKLPQKTP